MRPSELERAVRKRYRLSKRDACALVARGKRWRWLAGVSVPLFAWVTLWTI